MFRILVTLIYLILLSNNAFAFDDYPKMGIVYNTIENNSLTYDCKLLSNWNLKCDFTQTSIRKRTRPFGEAESQAKDEWAKNPEVFSKAECNAYKQMFPQMEKMFNGEIKADTENAQKTIDNMTSVSKKDMLATIRIMLSYCETPTLGLFMEIVKFEEDKNNRTCFVSSNNFSQTFNKMSNDTWVVIPEAYGECGIVQLDRFEKVDSGVNNIKMWNYISKKAITNPKANQGLLNLSCSGLDENEYLYAWNQREISMECDYIKFGF